MQRVPRRLFEGGDGDENCHPQLRSALAYCCYSLPFAASFSFLSPPALKSSLYPNLLMPHEILLVCVMSKTIDIDITSCDTILLAP